MYFYQKMSARLNWAPRAHNNVMSFEVPWKLGAGSRQGNGGRWGHVPQLTRTDAFTAARPALPTSSCSPLRGGWAGYCKVAWAGALARARGRTPIGPCVCYLLACARAVRTAQSHFINQKWQHHRAQAMHWVGWQPSAPLAWWLKRCCCEPWVVGPGSTGRIT